MDNRSPISPILQRCRTSVASTSVATTSLHLIVSIMTLFCCLAPDDQHNKGPKQLWLTLSNDADPRRVDWDEFSLGLSTKTDDIMPVAASEPNDCLDEERSPYPGNQGLAMARKDQHSRIDKLLEEMKLLEEALTSNASEESTIPLVIRIKSTRRNPEYYDCLHQTIPKPNRSKLVADIIPKEKDDKLLRQLKALENEFGSYADSQISRSPTMNLHANGEQQTLNQKNTRKDESKLMTLQAKSTKTKKILSLANTKRIDSTNKSVSFSENDIQIREFASSNHPTAIANFENVPLMPKISGWKNFGVPTEVY